MNMQQEAWAGEFGRAYTKRNRVGWEARTPFWGHIMGETLAASVLEVGCNAGWNLRAIRSLDRRGRRLAGIEINDTAIIEAQGACLDVRKCAAQDLASVFAPGEFDLVFTAGVLIHIPSADLESVMRSIIRTASRYVLAVEYASDVEEGVEYRGREGLLWRRPFGHLYERLGLALVDTGEAEGFDRCTYWLLEKV